jgi:hypothetical protein
MKVIVTQDDKLLWEQDGLWGGWTDFGPSMEQSTILLNVIEALKKALVVAESQSILLGATEIQKAETR